MALIMKLKHVEELSGGRMRFRKRYPQTVARVLGESVFQVAMRARGGAELVKEQERLLKEYETLVAKARRSAAENGQLSPIERWREMLVEAEELLAGVRGVRDEDEARRVLLDNLKSRNADPMLYKAVVSPDAEEPPVTMIDAKEIYKKERMGGATGRNQQNRLDRVCKRIENSLGPLNKLALVDLTREHARKLRDDMQATKKKDGTPLAPSTIRRELDMIRAIVSVGITEYDLQGKAYNRFEGLEVAADADSAPDADWDKRDPLPKAIILAMREHLKTNLREPALGHIWRLLEGTGCRGAEIVGLRVEDVKIDCPNPHICVAWHENRRVKTKVSIRSVPLIGAALVTAKDALKAAAGERMLFPRYAYDGAPDAVSMALMKHLRKFTKDKRHVVYSLRHNMKDYLVTAGVAERDEHRILGHSLGGVGNRVYGGDEAKLKVATEAMRKAIALAP
jgi:integrase